MISPIAYPCQKLKGNKAWSSERLPAAPTPPPLDSAQHRSQHCSDIDHQIKVSAIRHSIEVIPQQAPPSAAFRIGFCDTTIGVGTHSTGRSNNDSGSRIYSQTLLWLSSHTRRRTPVRRACKCYSAIANAASCGSVAVHPRDSRPNAAA